MFSIINIISNLSPWDKLQSLKLAQTREVFEFHPMIGLWKRSPDLQPHWRNLGLRRVFWSNQRRDTSIAEHQSWWTECRGCPPRPPSWCLALARLARSGRGWRVAAWREAPLVSGTAARGGVPWSDWRPSRRRSPPLGTAAGPPGWRRRGMTGGRRRVAWWLSTREGRSRLGLCRRLRTPTDSWKHLGRGWWQDWTGWALLVWLEESKSSWSRCRWLWRRSAWGDSAAPPCLLTGPQADPRHWAGTWSESSCSYSPSFSSEAGTPGSVSPGWSCCSCSRRGQCPRSRPSQAPAYHGGLSRSTCWGRDCDGWNSKWK